ncbi:trypsin-like peptidase domain-containing protein [Kitasatospora sp. NPDC085879]|uniref:trypsin-like peptidase domain-containing protein n=1 Tax=Kitasatospora sp. NPDC085879 TaxID=3154769 RepID=UPI0034357B72
MDRERLVEVVGEDNRGTGYLIGPRLVLTSAHVVGGVGTTARVLQPGRRPRYRSTVVWRGDPDGGTDAALVRVEPAVWQGPEGTAEPWGQLATMRPGQPVETWGVPWAIQDGGTAEAMQLSGTVNPGTGYVRERHFLTLSDHGFAQWAGTGVPWAGLSGAAVVCNGLLIGVVKADMLTFGHGMLEVVPAYVLHADGSFVAALKEHGADSSTLGQAEFDRLHRHDVPTPSTGPLPPAALLQAGREVVGFHGREDILDRLRGWCEPPGFGVRLLHGPGGQGKTRLAARLAETLRQDDPRWTVLWPDPAAPPDELAAVRDSTGPVLVVLDYAEARREQLSGLLRAGQSHRGGVPLKVLLLARTAGGWWDSAKWAADGAVLRRAPAEELPALAPDRETRALLYRQALTAFAERLPAPADTAEGGTWHDRAAELAAPRPAALASGNVLTLHMTALADLLDKAVGDGEPVLDDVGHDAEDRILEHERLYWAQVAHERPLPHGLGDGGAPADALATVALLGGVPLGGREREALLRRAPVLADLRAHEIRPVREWVEAVYPVDTENPWEVLQPDRLAERFVGRHVLSDPELVDGLLAGVGPGRTAVRALTVLARAAAHPPLIGRLDGLITEVCTRHAGSLGTATMDVATQVERPQPLVDALWKRTDDPATSLAELADLADRLPRTSRVLADWALRLVERLVELRRDGGTATVQERIALGVEYRRLGKRLSDVGRPAEALAAAEQAAELLRPLLDSDPLAVRLHVAAVLNNRSVCLATLGRRSEALEPAEQAVEQYRIVVGAEPVPEEARGQLVRALSSLSAVQSQLGRHQDALDTAVEAVKVQKELIPDGGPEAAIGLVSQLNNLSIRHTEAGAHRAAFEAAAEAVALCEPFAEQYPDAYLPDLNRVLGTLSSCYGDLGDHGRSLELARRCVVLREQLYREHPEAHRHSLAQGLNSLAIDLGTAGHAVEAVATAERSVLLYRELARSHADGTRDELAMALNTLANQRGDADDPDGALAAAEEACHIYTDLDEGLSDVFAADRAMSLGTVASCLTALGRSDEAIERSLEAVAIFRRLAESDPAPIAQHFASALHNLRLYLQAADRTADAVDLIDEALKTYADPDGPRADGIHPVTLKLLLGRTMCLTSTGQWDEAVATVRRAVEFARRVAALPSGPGPAEVVRQLGIFGAVAFSAGRSAEAADALAEQAELLRQLAVDDPQRYEGELAGVLGNAKNLLYLVDRIDEAEEAARRAVEVRGRLAERGGVAERVRLVTELAGLAEVVMMRAGASEALAILDLAQDEEGKLSADEAATHRVTLVQAHRMRGQLLYTVGRRDEALAVARESLRTAEEIAESAPDQSPGLAAALLMIGAMLVDEEQREEALDCLRRAVALCRPHAAASEPANEILLASCLGALGAALALEPADPQHALEATAEALAICRRRWAADPARGRAGLSRAAAQHGMRLAEAGRAEEGLPLVEEALLLARESADTDRRVNLFELVEALCASAEVRARAGREAATALDELTELLGLLREEQPGLVEQFSGRIADIRKRLHE